MTPLARRPNFVRKTIIKFSPSFPALLMLVLLAGLSGCDEVLGLDPTHLISPNAYQCACTCSSTVPTTPSILVNNDVCLPDALDPNNHSIPGPTQADLDADCSGRVLNNITGIVQECLSRVLGCSCVAAPIAGMFTAPECDQPCVGEDLASNCANWNTLSTPPVKTATNVPGQAPVCLVASSDPPNPVPDPLVADIFGHTSSCNVSGNVTVTRDGDTQSRAASGAVKITGSPCPGGSCKVGMSYRLDHIDNFTFEGFADFDSVEIKNLFASGASLPEAATVDQLGSGSFAQNTTQSFGQGKRSNQILGGEVSSDESAYHGSNGQPIGVNVDWSNHTCSLNGTLFGQLEEADTSFDANLTGTIVNEPPTANAGPPQNIECTSAAGAAVTLDASASSDPEDNIALYVWRQGTRAGQEIGNDPIIHVNQGLGVSENYFLRVVDTLGQASETSTSVTVGDTTPPVIASVTAAPNMLWPPNHKLVPVSVSVSDSDACDQHPACKIAQITSNEPISPADAQITGASTAKLTSERLGNGDGRIYTLTVQCTDASGNSSSGTTTVTVPHDKGK
jgi:hypothetical protein